MSRVTMAIAVSHSIRREIEERESLIREALKYAPARVGFGDTRRWLAADAWDALSWLIRDRDRLATTLEQIADGAESNPPHEIAEMARKALA